MILWVAIVVCLTMLAMVGIVYLDRRRESKQALRRWEEERRAKETEAILGLRDEE